MAWQCEKRDPSEKYGLAVESGKKITEFGNLVLKIFGDIKTATKLMTEQENSYG